MDPKTIIYCLLIFTAYVIINFIFNIIQKLIEASITKKALQEKIDVCYLKLIEKIKLLTKPGKDQKEGNKNEMQIMRN